MGNGIFVCPKYLGILIVFSILKSFEKEPKWMKFKWWLIIGFIFYTIISIIYGRYEEGITFGIITDILWLLLYSIILFVYLPKFETKDEVDERYKKIPLNIGKYINIITSIMISLSVIIIVLCICSFIPFLNFITIPTMRVIGMIL